jgi:heme/copper-type cytochrome/quinol oxidase subunit 3
VSAAESSAVPLDSSNAKRRRIADASLGQLGMLILLVSLSVLFIAASLAVLFTHHQVGSWRAPDRHGLPWGTAASTLLLGVVSFELQSGLNAVRSNRFTEALRGWRLGGGAALAFLIVQAWNVRVLTAIEGDHGPLSLFIYCYDLLVGLHAIHVLGGFVPLLLVHTRLGRRDYSSSRHEGVTFCVQYWHYLGAVWLVLLGVLLWVG